MCLFLYCSVEFKLRVLLLIEVIRRLEHDLCL